VPIVKKSGGLNLLEPCGPVMGQLLQWLIEGKRWGKKKEYHR